MVCDRSTGNVRRNILGTTAVKSPSRRFLYVVLPLLVVQILLAALALWVLADTKMYSYGAEEPLEYTWRGALVPGILFGLFCTNFCTVLLAARIAYWQRVLAICLLMAMAIVVAWWVLLAIGEHQEIKTPYLMQMDPTILWGIR